jgi:hypothetical protein
MARDIYVMLYTFGGGLDAIDYTLQNIDDSVAPPDGDLEPDLYGITDGDTRGNQAKQMAQLAVNIVDALDKDNTMTMFVYDENLGDGWNIDDYLYDDPDFDDVDIIDPNDVSRGVVFGVERQQLGFSEALMFVAQRALNGAMVPTDQTTTPDYNDEKHRDFTYIELENLLPVPVSFANEAWQIEIRPNDEGGTATGRRITLEAGAGAVAAGSRYTIGSNGMFNTAAYTAPHIPMSTSVFNVEPLLNGAMNPGVLQIAPSGTLDLDLNAAGLAAYRVNDGTKTGALAPFYTTANDGPLVSEADAVNDPPCGRLFEVPTAGEAARDSLTGWTDSDGAGARPAAGQPIEITIQLKRRLNPNRQPPTPQNLAGNSVPHADESQDNRWVVVDEITIPLRLFGLADMDDFDDIPDKLRGDAVPPTVVAGLISKERYEPLVNQIEDGKILGLDDQLAPYYQSFSIGEVNVISGTDPNIDTDPVEFSIWQPHFDRDYASSVELFGVPLYGPDELTAVMHDPGSTAPNFTLDDTQVAAFPILNPDAGVLLTADAPDNRWYRMLEFMEVPSRLHRLHIDPWYAVTAGTRNQLDTFYRVPGKLQLNTLRHPSVLAGLLDDSTLFDPLNAANFASGFDTPPALVPGAVIPSPLLSDGARDWFNEFLLSRDGRDALPVANGGVEDGAGNGLILPGLPTGEPFQSLASSLNANTPADPVNSIDKTVLRNLPTDILAALPRPQQRQLFEVGGAQGAADQNVRHRLLQKVMNNSTTRSNVFVVIMKIDYFEAKVVNDAGGTGGDVVRIGAKLADSPGQRAMYIIDRSKALELVNSSRLPIVEQAPINAQTYRFPGETGEPWQSLFENLVIHKEDLK